jgi:hypothetical protein
MLLTDTAHWTAEPLKVPNLCRDSSDDAEQHTNLLGSRGLKQMYR